MNRRKIRKFESLEFEIIETDPSNADGYILEFLDY